MEARVCVSLFFKQKFSTFFFKIIFKIILGKAVVGRKHVALYQ